MGDTINDETVLGSMVQTDSECKRNSVISGKPKPPLPKKPPVAVKPKVIIRGESQNKGVLSTSKSPPPLPKTPPRGLGSTAVKNALHVGPSASPDRACNIAPSLSNHVTESCSKELDSSNHISGTSIAAPSLTNHETESSNITLFSHHVEGEKGGEKVTAAHNIPTPYQTKSRTLERTCEQRQSPTYLAERSNTLPKTPPKVSPKPSKKPPNVLPKPKLSKKYSESDLNSSSESEKSVLYNSNTLDSSRSSSVSDKDVCHCDGISSTSDVKVDKMTDGRQSIVINEQLINSLNSVLQNGHSRPPPEKMDTLHCDSEDGFKQVLSKVDQSKFQNCDNVDSNTEMHNNLDDKTIKNHNDRVCMEDDIKETVKDLSSACKMSSENVDKNINQEIENKLSPELKEGTKENNRPSVDYLDGNKSVVNSGNSPLKTKVYLENNEVLSNNDIADESVCKNENLFKETEQNTCTPKLTVPSPAPRKYSPKPRPTPRKRLSISKSCEKTDNLTEYTDCISANSNTASSESLSQSSAKIELEHCVNTESTSICVSECADLSQSSAKIELEHCMNTESTSICVSECADLSRSSANVKPKPEHSVKMDSKSNCVPQSADLSLRSAKIELEQSVNTELKSVCVSPSGDQSIGNISKIDSNLTESLTDSSTGSKEKLSQLSNQKISHNLLQLDDKNLQKRTDFSPMTEEALGETSSLLDEIEQIVSRRISALGGLSSDFTFRKANSIETSTPVRPPRRKNRNRKFDQFQDSSDTDSLVGEASFKGSSSSLNFLEDGDQSFKGSNSSLASNQSESAGRRPCPPKPPRKKLLKLNRSQSDVSASKFLERNKENFDQIETEETEDNIHKKKVGGRSPNLPPRKGRSLTVDFHVPANQEPLLREIEIANQRNANAISNGQQIKPKRKAPPPPPKVKVTGPVQNNLIREAEYNVIDDDKPRIPSLGDQDYVEIPEEFMNANFQNNMEENDTFQRTSKSPSPPELPPRNFNPETPVGSPQLSIKSFNPSVTVTTPKHTLLRDRPISDVSQNSSLSSQECPVEDELSSTDSEGYDEENRAARKKAKKILCIAKEISSSEHVFVDVLRLLNVDFRLHISRATEKAGRPVIPSEVLNRILKFLPQLQNFNEDLLRDLEERVVNWEKCKQVADIFVRKGPFLKMYTSYITDFEETNKVFDDSLKKIPAFQQCVKEFEMSPRCASLGIRHYLLKPIQRIPQYKLLLQDYLKHLTPESEDYQNTCTALAIVSEVADHANDSMRQGDQVQKMLEIQKSLDGHFEVIKPGRDLIKEGELMKLSRKEMQPRMFFLFNDVLLYTTPTPTGGYRLNNVLTLVGMKVTLPAIEEYNTEFNIVGLQRSFAVEASSVEERDQWMKALTAAIEENTQRRNTFETVKAGNQSFYDKDFVLGSKAPIWIPDARVTMCMLCTCEFSVAWRRHHCRSCGRVICSSCSDNKAPLEYLRNKPARVCNECFQKLVLEFEDKVSTGTVTEGMTEDTDGSFLSLSSLKERFQQIRKSARFTAKVKRPGRLVEVRANESDCSMNGNLRILKGKKWKKFWFLLKDNALYKFKASEDVAAIESLAVPGYDVIRFSENFEGIASHLLFQLSHKNQSPLLFQTDNPMSTDRWVKAMEKAAKG